VLLRFPRQVAGIEGAPLVVAGLVANPRTEAIDVRLSAGAGAVVVPPGGRLAAGGSQEVSLTVAPAAGTLHLECAAAGLKRTRAIECVAVPRGEVTPELAQGLTLRFVRMLDVEGLSHRSGQAADDAAAAGGKTWAALPGRDAPGHILFGPYAPTPAGTYLALFRVRRGDGEAADQPLLTLDTCLADPLTVTAERRLSVAETPAGGYRWVALRFTHPGGPLETRAQWSGAAPAFIDSIGLWAVVASPADR
jgi:hypothetical protein